MKVGVPLIVVTVCWFVLVIAYGWVMRALPTSGNVIFFLMGLTIVGAVFGFIVSSVTNFIFRARPQKWRMAMSAVVWLALIALLAKVLVSVGADLDRTLIAAGITAACGLLVGPYYAELLIGAWFLKRYTRRQPKSS